MERDHARQAAAERNSPSFAVQMVLSTTALGLAPLVPRSEHVFGTMTPGIGLLIIAPALVVMVFRRALYRGDPTRRAYRLVDGLETALMYSEALWFVFGSGLTWSLLWVLCPFSSVFFAVTRPFYRWFYLPVIAISHGSHALACLLRGTTVDAAVTLLFGAVGCVIYLLAARVGQRSLHLQAERNVIQAELNETLLDRERSRIANALNTGVGHKIAELVKAFEGYSAADGHELPAGVTAQAQTALDELKKIVGGSRSEQPQRSVASLGETLELKCRPLCEGLQYVQQVEGVQGGPVSQAVELAVVRVAQELVRNAVTHAKATTVSVTLGGDAQSLRLKVRNDGLPFSAEVFAGATGGLGNARLWLAELRGSLTLQSAQNVTELEAIVPRG